MLLLHYYYTSIHQIHLPSTPSPIAAHSHAHSHEAKRHTHRNHDRPRRPTHNQPTDRSIRLRRRTCTRTRRTLTRTTRGRTTRTRATRRQIHIAIPAQPQRQPLIPKRDVLRHTCIVALAITDIQAHQISRCAEEHESVLRQAREAAGVVWEAVAGVGRGGVAQQDAGVIVGVCHLGVVSHDVAVGGVCDEDEATLGKGLEDFC